MADHFTLDVDPDATQAAADALGELSGVLGSRAEQVAGEPSAIGSAWTGQAATAVKAEMRGLADHTETFSTHFATASQALSTLAQTYRDALRQVEDANRQWVLADEAYEEAVDAAGREYRRSLDALDPGPGRTFLQHELEQSRGWAVSEAGDARRRRRHDLEYSVGMLRLWLGQQTRAAGDAMAAAVVAPVPDETVSTYVASGVSDGFAAAPYLVAGMPLSEQRNRQAAELTAGRLWERVLPMVQGGRFDDAALDELEAALADPWVATALVERIGPENLATLPFWVAQGADSYGPLRFPEQGYGDPDDPYGGQDYLEDGERLVDLLAGALTTATHDPGLDPGFVQGLQDAVGTPEGGYGLSALMTRGGTWDTDVAVAVSQAVLARDRQVDGALGWVNGLPPGAGIPRLFGTDNHGDPLIGVSNLLARDPAAAQQFLVEDGVVEYLAGEREWPWHDDKGAAFGALLETATTTHRDSGPVGGPGWTSAEITGRLVEALGGERGGDVPDGMQASIGTILSQYVDDVHRVGASRSGDSVHGAQQGEGAWGAGMDRDSLRALVGGLSDEAYADLLAHQGLKAQSVMDAAAASGDPERIDAALQDIASTLGMLTEGISSERIAEGAASDARTKAFLDLAGGVLGLPTVPGGSVVNFVVGQGTEQVLSRFETDHAGDAVRDANGRVDVVRALMEDLTSSAMLEHGFFHEPDGDGGTRPAPTHPWNQPYAERGSAGDFLDRSGDLLPWDEMTPAQRDAYQNWRFADPEVGAVFEDRDTSMEAHLGSQFPEYRD
ncbi:DUF6571 family protein [Thalassiella azotivora]